MDTSQLATTTRTAPDQWQKIIGLLGQLYTSGSQSQQASATPFQPVPLADTMAPPSQMGGGNMAAIQQALQMLAQMMQQRQTGGSELPGPISGIGGY